MGGKHGECDGPMEWPEDIEKMFLDILFERVKKDINGTPTFKSSDWVEMNDELFLTTGTRYGADRLKGKYNRLRTKYCQFSELIEHIGVTIDTSSNKVLARLEVWENFFKKHKVYRTFKRLGCKNYDLLGQIFNNSTSTGTLHCASTQPPPSSDKDRAHENEFLNFTMHVEDLDEVVGDNSRTTKKGKEKRLPDSFEDYQPGSTCLKRGRMSKQLSSMFDVLASSINIRNEMIKEKAEKCKSVSSPLPPDPYSIEVVMDALNALDGISDESYIKALDFFPKPSWRKMFVRMPEARKKAWLQIIIQR